MIPSRPGPERSEGRHLATTLEILMFITALAGAAMAVAAALVLGLLGVLAGIGQDPTSALTGVWMMAGALAVAAALAPAAYWSGRAVFGYPAAPAGRPGIGWLWLMLAYPVCLVLGWLAHNRGTAPLLLGPLALVGTACLSIFFVAWLVRRLGPAVTPLRAWGHFTIGLTAMPFAAMVFEFLAIIPILVVLGFWLLTSPEGQLLASALRDSSGDPELAMQHAAEFLQSPFILFGVYGYLGLAIPVIEELLKTMAVWPFLRRGLPASAAFLGGALGGAGYALFEALFLTQPGETWLPTTMARLGATVLHVFTAALTSYGLVEAVRRRRFLVGLATLLAAIAMHALWNLSAVTIGIATAPIAASPPPLGPEFGSLAVLVLVALAVGSGLGLVLAWGRLARGSGEASERAPATIPG